MIKHLTTGLISVLLCTSLFGQSKIELELERKLLKKIELHIKNSTLLDALSLISKKSGIRITNKLLIDPMVKISEFSENSTCENIIQRLLDQEFLTYIPQQDGTIKLVNILPNSSIYGNIFDKDNAEPLPLANIYLENTSMGHASDKNGYFLIQNIPSGIFRMQVQFIGYKPQVFRLNLLKGKRFGLNIFLERDVLQMTQINVVADIHEDVIHKEQISTYTLKPRQLNLQPSHGEKDILRSIQILPGVTATSEYKSQFYIRGGNSDQNLVLLNGGVLYNPFHFSGILSAFDIDALEKVDVYLGGFSAEFGSRLSSVLDIRTRRGADKFNGLLNVSPISTKLLVEFPDDIRWGSFLCSYRRSNINTFSKRLGDRVEPDFYDFIINHDIHPPGKMSISFTGFFSSDKVILQKADNNRFIKSNNKLLTLNIKRFQTKNLTLLSDISAGQFSASLPPSQEIGKLTKNKLRDFSVTFKVLWQLYSNFKITTGIDYRNIHAKYESADLIISQLTSNETTFDKAFYIQSLLKLKEKFEFETGLRFQSYRPDESFLIEPRIGVRYKLYNFFSFKGGYGRFSQNLVTIYNENDTYNPIDIWLSPSSSLKYATSDHFIFGLDYKTGVINFTIEAYWKLYNNLTHYNRERLNENDPYFIQGKGSSKGVDFSIQILNDAWQVLSSYSLGKASKELPFQYPEPHRVNFSPRYDRRHNFNFSFSAKPIDKLEISTKFTLGTGLPFTFITAYYNRLPGESVNPTSDFISDNENATEDHLVGIKSDINAFRFPTYHRLDISVKYSLSWGRFAVKPYLLFLNLYNQKNVLYYDSKGVPHWSLSFLPMIGVDFDF